MIDWTYMCRVADIFDALFFTGLFAAFIVAMWVAWND